LAELNLKFKHLQEALIFDIKHNSLEDGPGIRSVVFFKGCPLNCVWCQNPEGKKLTPELYWENEKCISCGSCIEVCPENAISFDFQKFIDRELCNNCFECVDICPSTALKIIGVKMSVDEIISKILPYKNYFANLGGGVTLSGGEAMLHMDFASELLKKLQSIGIHTLLETSGYFNFEKFKRLIVPFVDEIYYDIKFIDNQKHKQWCGVSNTIILDNFKRLHKHRSTAKFNLVPRTALLPNITDAEENIRAIANFYKSLCVTKTILLLNNPDWFQKLDKLGYRSGIIGNEEIRSLYPLRKEVIVNNYFKEYGIDVDFG
jgi:pyruvate formate lyase activating enzyme